MSTDGGFDCEFNDLSETYHVICDSAEYEEVCAAVEHLASRVPGLDGIDADERVDRGDVESLLSRPAESFDESISVTYPACVVTLYATGQITLALRG